MVPPFGFGFGAEPLLELERGKIIGFLPPFGFGAES